MDGQTSVKQEDTTSDDNNRAVFPAICVKEEQVDDDTVTPAAAIRVHVKLESESDSDEETKSTSNVAQAIDASAPSARSPKIELDDNFDSNDHPTQENFYQPTLPIHPHEQSTGQIRQRLLPAAQQRSGLTVLLPVSQGIRVSTATTASVAPTVSSRPVVRLANPGIVVAPVTRLIRVAGTVLRVAPVSSAVPVGSIPSTNLRMPSPIVLNTNVPGLRLVSTTTSLRQMVSTVSTNSRVPSTSIPGHQVINNIPFAGQPPSSSNVRQQPPIQTGGSSAAPRGQPPSSSIIRQQPPVQTGVSSTAPRQPVRPTNVVEVSTSTSGNRGILNRKNNITMPTLTPMINKTKILENGTMKDPLVKQKRDVSNKSTQAPDRCEASTSPIPWSDDEDDESSADHVDHFEDIGVSSVTSFKRGFPDACCARCEVMSVARLRHDQPTIFSRYAGIDLGPFEVLAKDVADYANAFKDSRQSNGESEITSDGHQKKPTACFEDELLLTLMKLKTNFPARTIAYLFGYEPVAVIDILQHWLPLLAIWTEPFIIWPSNKDTLTKVIPVSVKEELSYRPLAVLDVLEIKLTGNDQNEMNCSVKVVIAYNWRGAIIYRSRLFDGQEMSDRDAINACGDDLGFTAARKERKLETNDVYLVLKDSYVANRHCFLIKRSRQDFATYVGRVSSGLSRFAIMSDIGFPPGLIAYVDDIITICCALVNLSPVTVTK